MFGTLHIGCHVENKLEMDQSSVGGLIVNLSLSLKKRSAFNLCV